MKRDEDFSAYVAARWHRMVRSAVLLGCTSHEAEDVVQTTFTRCYEKWAAVSRADNRDAYVHRMLVNCFNDSHRRRWWQERPTESLPEMTEGPDREGQFATHDAIERALACLTPALRVVVVLRFYAQLSETEAADALGVPLGTIKSRSSRALADLARNSHLTGLVDESAS